MLSNSLATFSILPSKIVELQSLPTTTGHSLKVSTESYQQHQLIVTPRSTSINLNTANSSTCSESSSSNRTSSYHNVTKTTLLRQELDDSQSSGESPIPPAPPCNDLNLNSCNSGSESSFVSEIKSKHQQVISKINSIDIILNEPAAADNELMRAKTARIRREDQKSGEKRLTIEDIEPMKDLLHDELMKRMSRDKPFFKREEKAKPVVNYLNTTSSSEDVRNFLVAKEFSQK